MIILGLHFGHDASVSVLHDGRLASHVLQERYTRTKKAVALTADAVQVALKAAGVGIEDVDYCAIVSTQDLEILTGMIEGFSISLEESSRHRVPSPYKTLLAESGVAVDRLLSHGLRELFAQREDESNRLFLDRWKRMLPEWPRFERAEIASVGWLNVYTTHGSWHQQRPLEQLRQERLDPATFSDQVRLGMHYPVTVQLFGQSLPAYFIDHHVCHGASVFYRSGFEDAAILTVDGGDPSRNLSGYFLYGRGHELYVLAPHQLALGNFYRNTGVALGFDVLGAEGKLMGLSSYGSPRFFDSRFVANVHEIIRDSRQPPFRAWLNHCRELATRRGYEVVHGTPDTVLGRFSVDMAASTQKLFEETYLRSVEILENLLHTNGRSTRNLCLSGGCALNCPSNSRLFREAPYDRLYIEPNCDDGGLSAGAALYLHHNMLEHSVDPGVAAGNRSPYLGVPIGRERLRSTLGEAAGRHDVTQPRELARAAASDLAEDRVVAWVEGRSEMGPRALCHRSLLANPTKDENWARVNAIKGRETWRPLAPAVLASDVEQWFRDGPSPSPYMLFTARVKGSRLPAVTHVDGTARIQTVDEEAGHIFGVLRELKALSGVPVVLNTSLNGPGEPIVEQPAEALAFFERAGVDVLYLEGHRIAKA